MLATEGKEGKNYKLIQEIKVELKGHQSLFGQIAWSIEDLTGLFKDYKEKVPPKKILRKIADELSDTVADAMCEEGWNVIIDFVQDFIAARKELGKQPCQAP